MSSIKIKSELLAFTGDKVVDMVLPVNVSPWIFHS